MTNEFEEATSRFRNAYAELIAAAKAVIEACDDPGTASGDIWSSIERLRDEVAKGEELKP